MSFGPKNAPAFYTAMMKILHDESVILFHSTKECVPSDPSISKIFWDSKTIINDTLIFFNHIPTLLHYFSCVAQVFTKYRLSFKMSKCDFFLPRVEYVGHDLWLVVTIQHNPSFSSSRIGLILHTVYLFSHSLDYVPFIAIMFHGLKIILNHSVAFNVFIIVNPYQFLLGRPCSSSYSDIVKFTSLFHPSFSDMIVLSQLF